MNKCEKAIQEYIRLEIGKDVTIKDIKSSMRNGKMWLKDKKNGIIVFKMKIESQNWFILLDCIGSSGCISIEAQNGRGIETYMNKIIEIKGFA